MNSSEPAAGSGEARKQHPGRPALTTNWLALNVLLLAVIAVLSLTYPVDELSRRLGDTFFRLRAHQPTSSKVAMVVIDDASLEHYGRWPWPRAQLARLVRGVSGQRPAAIGLDILLSEPGDPNEDNELERAIRHAGNVVLAAKLSNAPARLWTDPLPLFRAASAGVGHVQAAMDADGIGRSVPLVELSAEGPRWPLAVELARVTTGQPIRVEDGSLWLGNRRIWLEGHSTGTGATGQTVGWTSYSPQFLMPDFRQQFVPDQPDPPFVAISAATILDGRAPPQLQGKIVLLGFGASDLSDRLPTPVSGQTPMPGVEVHANLLETLLNGTGIRHARLGLQVLLLVLFSLLSTWLVLHHPGWQSLWIPLILFLACYAAGVWLFQQHGILLNLGPLLIAAVLAVPLAQLENLTLVNRALNRGLDQLRGTLFSGPKAGQLPGFQPDSTTQDSANDLQQKLDLIHTLQSDLASSYTFRQNLLESMHEGIAVFDTTGKMEFCNPYWEKFCLKQNWNSALRLTEFGDRLGHPRWSNLEKLLQQDSPPPESEVYLGGGFWQVRAMHLPPEGPRAPRWMVVITDLTSRLERDQARAEALRFVTHELRTPLVSIQGFAEFLLRYPKAADSSGAAATIFRESQRLVSLINTYLDVLRFDAGARSLRHDKIVVADMIAQVDKVMAPIAEASEIRVRLDVNPQLPDLIGDQPMLTGVLLNLLNNAVKYSPSGSEVSLAVRPDHSELISELIFEVCNPGAPIPPERLSHLFEPFYRAHEHDSSTPGWGLGLTFVKRIVEEHHGAIEATSDEQGIRVRVRIPVNGFQRAPLAV
jgi:signal transduction histidine kinase/CHASE2 domain-containing sensor protein